MSRGRLLCWSALAGCGFEAPDAGPTPLLPVDPPAIESMNSSAVRVGDTLAFTGRGFIAPGAGMVDVTFRGTFRHDDATFDVDTTLIAERIDLFRIEMRFGPFDIPFTAGGNITGVFRGRVFATNRAFDGPSVEQTDGPEVELSVLPSIVVRALEPKLERLDLDPPEAVAEMPYRLMVEAVDFPLASIEYELGPGALIDGAHVAQVIHDVVDATDTLGDRELFSFAAVPSGTGRSVVPIVIRAASDEGVVYSLELNAVVR
jgi:hypothetical protein